MEQNKDTESKEGIMSKEMLDVLPDHLQDILDRSQGMVTTAFGKCIIVSVCLPSGYIITETFSFAREKNFNAERGHEACMAKIIDRLYDLESFRLLAENPEPYEAPGADKPKGGIIIPNRDGNIIMPPDFG